MKQGGAARPRLVLHVGTHKTGTKSIQKAAADHAGHLRRHGVYYPHADAEIGGRRPQHRFAHVLTRTDPDGWAKASAFAARVRANAAPGETVLFSAEPIYRHQYGKDKDDFSIDPATFWPAREAYLARVRQALDAFDVEILIYFRARDTMAESWYWDWQAKYGQSVPFPDFLLAFAPWFDYERHVTLFREIFGRVKIARYEEAKAAPDGLVGHFFRTIGVPGLHDLAALWEHRGTYGGDAFGTPEARAAFLSRYPDTIPA